MAHPNTTPPAARLEGAATVLFCLVDDAYRLLNPKGDGYGALKRLSDSEVLALALFQQLRGVESERSFLRDAERFFAHLFPGVVGLHPSSFHRRLRKLRRFLEPLRRAVLGELVGDPETLVVDSTLLAALYPRQVKQSAGFEGAGWARWGSFAVYGVKLHLLCSTNRVPLSYELTAASVRTCSWCASSWRSGPRGARRRPQTAREATGAHQEAVSLTSSQHSSRRSCPAHRATWTTSSANCAFRSSRKPSFWCCGFSAASIGKGRPF